MTSIRLQYLTANDAYMFTFGSIRVPMAGGVIFNTRDEAKYAADLQGFVLRDDNTIVRKCDACGAAATHINTGEQDRHMQAVTTCGCCFSADELTPALAWYPL